MDIGLLIMHDAATKQFAAAAKEAWHTFVVSTSGVNQGYEVKAFSVNRDGMGNSFSGQEVAEQLDIPFSSGLAIIQLKHGSKVEEVVASAAVEDITDMDAWFRSVLIEDYRNTGIRGLRSLAYDDATKTPPEGRLTEKQSLGKQIAEAVPALFCLFYPDECKARQNTVSPGVWVAVAAIVMFVGLAITFKK